VSPEDGDKKKKEGKRKKGFVVAGEQLSIDKI